MSRKLAFAATAALALGLLIAAPSFAISTIPSPLNSDGTPRFSDPNAAPRTFNSGPGQVTTTFGSGSFTFGATVSNGVTPGFGNPGSFNAGPTSPYYNGPPSSGFTDPASPDPLLPDYRFNPGISPYYYNPAPPRRIDPNRPR